MKRRAGRLRSYAPALVFGGLFCVMLALHAVMPVDLGDDLMYRDMLQRMSLKVFKSGATSTATTLVIGLIRGSLISPRMILESSLRTSSLILVFLILFFRILPLFPSFYLGTSTIIYASI